MNYFKRHVQYLIILYELIIDRGPNIIDPFVLLLDTVRFWLVRTHFCPIDRPSIRKFRL